MRRRALLAVAAGLVAVLTIVIPASALEIPPHPTDVPVVDQTGTLNSEQIRQLSDAIAGQRQKTNNQIAILMIPSLQGDALEDYSLRVARGWGIGGSQRDSGVLLLVVKNDRKVRIEVGYGLEGALPDATASRIIRERITPKFRQNDYFGGLQDGLGGITAAINGEADSAPGANGKNQTDWSAVLFGLLFAPIWLGSILARSKSWWAGGVIGGLIGVVIGLIAGFVITGILAIIGLAIAGLAFDWFVSRTFQRQSRDGVRPSWWIGGPWIGGSGGGSGGGFGGFGGGGFGGGGASGGW